MTHQVIRILDTEADRYAARGWTQVHPWRTTSGGLREAWFKRTTADRLLWPIRSLFRRAARALESAEASGCRQPERRP